MGQANSGTWRVVDEAGEAHEVALRTRRNGWLADGVDDDGASYWETQRLAVLQLALERQWLIVEVVAPGEPTRDELRSALADAVTGAAIEARSKEESWQECDELREQTASAWADGARAMQKAAVLVASREANAWATGQREVIGVALDGLAAAEAITDRIKALPERTTEETK